MPIAISTDSNPGTSPTTSLLLMMNMATTLFRMTVPEVLQGVTAHAARALGQGGHARRAARWGARRISPCGRVDTLAELAYWIGRPLCARVVRSGRDGARNVALHRAAGGLTDVDAPIRRDTYSLFAEHAYLPDGWRRNVLLEWDANGTLTAVTPDTAAPHDVGVPAGPVLPGMPNLHSHAFQRAMAGLTEYRRERHRQLLELARPDVPLCRADHAAKGSRRSRSGFTSRC